MVTRCVLRVSCGYWSIEIYLVIGPLKPAIPSVVCRQWSEQHGPALRYSVKARKKRCGRLVVTVCRYEFVG